MNRRSRRRSDRMRRRALNTGPAPSQQALGRMFVGVAVLIALLVIGSSALSRLRSEPSATPPELVAVPGAVAVEVVRIIDGDTLDVRSADGATLRVRLYGIDAPERGERCYDEASERLRSLATSLVQLLSDARLTDPNGRELRYVYTADALSVDETLVREGLAVAWREDGAMRDELVALEAEARAAHRGCLWRG